MQTTVSDHISRRLLTIAEGAEPRTAEQIRIVVKEMIGQGVNTRPSAPRREQLETRDHMIRLALENYPGTPNAVAVAFQKCYQKYITTRWKIECGTKDAATDSFENLLFQIATLNNGKTLSIRQISNIAKGHRGRWKQFSIDVSNRDR